MKRLGVTLLSALVGCGGCDDGPAAPPPPKAAAVEALPAPDPWLLGAAKGEAGLPPPCRLDAAVLGTVLSRETRIVAEPRSLGRILVGEGASHVVQEHPDHPVLALKRWSADAAGVMTMAHGRASVVPSAWVDPDEPGQVARSGEAWLLLVDDGETAWLQRGDRRERLGATSALTPRRLGCDDQRCALVTPRLDDMGHPAGGGATVRVGVGDRPLPSWRQRAIGDADSRALAAWGSTVAVASAQETLILAVDDEPRVVARLPSRYGALAASPRPLFVAARAADPEGTRCRPEAGGLVLVGPDREVHLRSAMPAERADITPLEGGALVTWLAPARCDGPRQTLHAVVVKGDGTPIAPVTKVDSAEDYAVAAEGERVDLWIRRPGGMGGPQDMGAVHYLRARCRP
ncbi:MAG: hypothetical protein R3B72_17540 [Polyangiaceae bacterium]